MTTYKSTDTAPFAAVAAQIIAVNIRKVFPDKRDVETRAVHELMMTWANGLRMKFNLEVSAEEIVWVASGFLMSQNWTDALSLDPEMRAYIEERTGR